MSGVGPVVLGQNLHTSHNWVRGINSTTFLFCFASVAGLQNIDSEKSISSRDPHPSIPALKELIRKLKIKILRTCLQCSMPAKASNSCSTAVNWSKPVTSCRCACGGRGRHQTMAVCKDEQSAWRYQIWLFILRPPSPPVFGCPAKSLLFLFYWYWFLSRPHQVVTSWNWKKTQLLTINSGKNCIALFQFLIPVLFAFKHWYLQLLHRIIVLLPDNFGAVVIINGDFETCQ